MTSTYTSLDQARKLPRLDTKLDLTSEAFQEKVSENDGSFYVDTDLTRLPELLDGDQSGPSLTDLPSFKEVVVSLGEDNLAETANLLGRLKWDALTLHSRDMAPDTINKLFLRHMDFTGVDMSDKPITLVLSHEHLSRPRDLPDPGPRFTIAYEPVNPTTRGTVPTKDSHGQDDDSIGFLAPMILPSLDQFRRGTWGAPITVEVSSKGNYSTERDVAVRITPEDLSKALQAYQEQALNQDLRRTTWDAPHRVFGKWDEHPDYKDWMFCDKEFLLTQDWTFADARAMEYTHQTGSTRTDIMALRSLMQ